MKHPYRDAPTTQAPNYAKATVVAAHDNGTDGFHSASFADRTGQRCHLARTLPFCLVDSIICTCFAREIGGRYAALPAILSVSAREANGAPATKRISGPKLHAAGAPRKWSPDIDVSNPASSWGNPSIRRIDFNRSSERNE